MDGFSLLCFMVIDYTPDSHSCDLQSYAIDYGRLCVNESRPSHYQSKIIAWTWQVKMVYDMSYDSEVCC